MKKQDIKKALKLLKTDKARNIFLKTIEGNPEFNVEFGEDVLTLRNEDKAINFQLK